METNVIGAGGMLSALRARGMEKRLANPPSVNKAGVIS